MAKLSKVCIVHDPGTKIKTIKDRGSYAYAVLKGSVGKGNKLVLTVLRNGTLPATLSQIKEGRLHHEQLGYYLRINEEMFDTYKPNFFVAERFQSRGIKGMAIESINQMLGALTSRIGIPYAMFAPVTWKRAVEKWGIDLDKMYKMSKTTPHQVDAVMLGAFALARALKTKHTKLNVKELLKQIEETSKTKLFNRRKK